MIVFSDFHDQFPRIFHNARKQSAVCKEQNAVGRSILWKLLNPKEIFPLCWWKQYQSEDLKVWRCQGGLLFSILDFVGRIYVSLDFLYFLESVIWAGTFHKRGAIVVCKNSLLHNPPSPTQPNPYPSPRQTILSFIDHSYAMFLCKWFCAICIKWFCALSCNCTNGFRAIRPCFHKTP